MIFDLLFPKQCVACSRTGSYLCKYCHNHLQPTHPECYVCRRVAYQYQTHPKCIGLYSRVSIAYKYTSITGKLIKIYKYKAAYSIATSLFTLLDERFTNYFSGLSKENFAIIAIPIHPVREKERGFNQSSLVVNLIAKKYRLHDGNNLVSRIINTKKQSQKTRDDRKSLSTDVFRISPEIVSYKTILVLDDVISTGSTLEAFGQAIKNIHPSVHLEAIALFRGRPYYLNNTDS